MVTLVLCEKPDVASRLAKALGGGTCADSMWSCKDDVNIMWCQGHLLTLFEPQDYNPKHTPSWVSLPILPKPFQLKPKSDWARHHLRLISKQLVKADQIVNACDAGREGELIFTSVVNHCLSPSHTTPVYRMWFSATDNHSLITAWAEKELITSRHKALYDAGLARMEADWLFGINGSQALNLSIQAGVALNQKDQVLNWSLGRVQTATLGLIYAQHKAINHFTPQPYYSVYIHFPRNKSDMRKDIFPARILVPEGGNMFQDKKVLFENPREASLLIQLIKRNKREFWSIADTVEVKSIRPFLLLDLTSLQRELVKKWAWGSKYTLELAQSCYERGWISYPRTDSTCLPSKIKDWTDSLFDLVLPYFKSDKYTLDNFTKPSTCPNTKKIFNDKRVSDHHGLLPISIPPKPDPSSKELQFELDCVRLWEYIAQRFILATGLICEVEHLTRTCNQATVLPKEMFGKQPGDPITISGIAQFKRVTKKGWLEHAFLWEHATPMEELPNDVFPTPAKEWEDKCIIRESDAFKSTSKPPEYFTEGDVLRLMETDCLGTPATRAGIIDILFQRDYTRRMKKQQGKVVIMMTARGLELGERLIKADIAFLLQAATTGKWEAALQLLEREKASLMTLAQFRDQVIVKTKEIVEKLKAYADSMSKPTSEICPKSGQPILENENEYTFPGYPGLRCPKHIAGAFISKYAYIEILTRSTGYGPFRFMSKKGKRFKAMLVYKPDANKIELAFD